MEASQASSFVCNPARVVPTVERSLVDLTEGSPKIMVRPRPSTDSVVIPLPTTPSATLTAPIAAEPPAFEYKIYFYCLASGYLTGGPFFAVITCMYFYEQVYIPAGFQPQFTLPMVLVIPGVIVQFLAIVFGKRVLRAIPLWISFIIITATFYPMIYFTKYITDKVTSFYALLAICAVQSCFQSLAVLLYYDVAAALDTTGRYASGIVVGTSLGGISSVLLEMLCLAAYGSDTDPYNYTSVFYNFVLALLVVCIITSVTFERHPLVAKQIAATQPALPAKILLITAAQTFLSQGKNIFFTYILTYMVYPGVVINQYLGCVPVQWSVPLIVFFFSIFDSTAKIVFNFYPVIPKNYVIVPVLLRTILCVFLIFIGYAKFNGTFVVDWWIIVCLSIFAFTNGNCAAVSMKYGSADFEAQKKPIVSKIMSFYLASGTAIGTILSQYIFAKITPDNE